MKYLDLWLKDKISKNPIKFESPLKIEGIREKHIGPRLEYAKVVFVIESSSNFEVIIKDELIINEYIEKLVNSSIFGLLDIILNIDYFSFKEIKITIEKIEIDEINSSVIAFRNAGRDAGKKILEELKINHLFKLL